MRTLVMLNGPPQCGKDTAGGIISTLCAIPSHIDKFARVVKDRTHAAYGISNATHDAYEHCKDDPHPDFLGISPRDAYIAFSEAFLKPLHGKQIFGEFLARDLEHVSAPVSILTDCGFQEEIPPVLALFDQAYIIRLHRRGKSFRGDSRSYVYLQHPRIEATDIANDGSIAELSHALIEFLPILPRYAE